MQIVTMGAVLAMALVGCATTTTDNRLVLSGYDYIDQGDWSAAERELNSALDVNPDNPYALLNLGVVYENTGRPGDARDMYERVIKSKSNAVASRSTVDAERGEKLTGIATRNLETLR